MRKNVFRVITKGSLLLLIAAVAHGQGNPPVGSKWKEYISLSDYLIPFWRADTVFDETVQLIKDNGKAEGTLLFKARKILSVKSADQLKSFVRKKDWIYKKGKLVPGSKSSIPYIKKEDLAFTTEKPGWSMKGKIPGTFVLFSESTFFRSKQIAVTYIPQEGERWKGPLPVFAESRLPHTISRLKNRGPLKIVFYGNSIETGYNSSGFQHQSPYMPSWPELIVYQLRQFYGAAVNFSNPSVPGKLAGWGRESVSGLVIPEKPDLVIIGFGMNDGSSGVPPEQYRRDIRSIIDSVRIQNPRAEFILIAPMLANPHAIQSGIQRLYKTELDSLAETGIVVADLTGVHSELLRHKNYQDMTGNNVNHPNDYLARWYAQFISGFLIPSPPSPFTNSGNLSGPDKESANKSN